MPIQIAELLNDERTITVTIGGQEGKVTYRPGAMTPELEMVLSDGRGAPEAVAEVISALLIEWDVLDENGDSYPTDSDSLMTLPSELLAETFRAISMDMVDRREERKNSGGGSPREASKAKRRNGTSFSRPRKS
jgi:hypothetical protein